MSIVEGDRVRIKLREDCSGGGRPHDPVEDGKLGKVTGITMGIDHPLFVLFGPGGTPRPTGHNLPLGRRFAEDELERLR